MYAAVTRLQLAEPLTEDEYRRVKAGGEEMIRGFAQFPGLRAYYAIGTVGSAEMTTIHIFDTQAQWEQFIKELEPAALKLLGPQTRFERSGGEVAVALET